MQEKHILYHYTSLEGLLGIIKSQSIWASHSEYLNDSSEYKHSLDFAKEYAGIIHMEDDYLSGFAWVLNKALRNMQDSHIYISSFSEVPDLLSQWRGYCPKGEGVCIGFNKELLEQYCLDNKFIIEKCIYNHNKQQDKILELINQALSEFPKLNLTRKQYNKSSTTEQCDFEIDSQLCFTEGDGKEVANEALTKLCNSLQELAPYMKNQAFQEEAEWRIIAKDTDIDIDINFRTAVSHFIPYIVLPVIKAYKEIISEIIIGPSANKARSISSIQLLLDKHGMSNVVIKNSNVPLNNW